MRETKSLTKNKWKMKIGKCQEALDFFCSKAYIFFIFNNFHQRGLRQVRNDALLDEKYREGLAALFMNCSIACERFPN